jgi:Phytanoyl-CoA dioxygenase (PhyH)
LPFVALLNDPRADAALERDGYAVVDGFLDRGDIAQLMDVFRSNDSPTHHAPFSASVLSDDVQYRAAVDREIKAVLRDKVDAVFDGYRHCFSNFVVKAPSRTAGEVPVHQDITFVDETRYLSLGIFAPLVDTTPGNGCLLVAPGSHRLNGGPRAVGTRHPYEGVTLPLQPVPMKAGSVMIFSQKLFHASQPNRSKVTRVVVGGLFVPREAQLYCYYHASPEQLEVYAVDDLFYTRYIYRTRPEGVPRVGVVDYWYDRIAG